MDQSFRWQGPKLFNSIPQQIRNLSGSGIEDFKCQLDAHMDIMYDEPEMPGLVPRGVNEHGVSSNSIVFQKKNEGRASAWAYIQKTRDPRQFFGFSAKF